MTTKQLLITDRAAVRESFGKSEKEVKKDIAIILEWFKTQPHLPEVPDDAMIENFLVTNKFSIERTKQKLDMYYTIRTLMPEIYENSNPKSPRMQNIDSMGIFVPLPKLTKELYRVYVMKICGPPENYDMYTFFAHALNVIEIRIHHDTAVGDVYIIDHEQLKMGHLVKMTPTHIKKAITIAEKVFSNRIKNIHLINQPSYIETLMNISKTLMKPKILARLHLHSSIEGLHEYLSKEILPKDYNGEELSLQELNDLWKVSLKEHADRFDKLDKLKIKEDLRPTPLQNDEVLGYHGNFKKLDVD
ncbi:alpha-tocopherol transfer protein-like [Anoplophora glabripennis]|uniref:alpha-tocopherol transfer protein-like n=1 Tax=Anoplophora glabripennis TaxID=217634 RepID=UPI0008744DB8|nr:alpha-tocopherol transfer protein-like [Anoplophora glabripennis]XP_018564498.1 alpha-tocopherol transfer protein-like [Anoplophora glabripennis]XP_018564499.1 alpha-tocopherol transfer protein-like [Anoplophora glabripennis]